MTMPSRWKHDIDNDWVVLWHHLHTGIILYVCSLSSDCLCGHCRLWRCIPGSFFFGTFPSLLERIVLTCPRKAHENVIVTPVNRNEVNNKMRKSRQWMSLRFTTETKIWQQKKSKSYFFREWFIKSGLCQLSGRLFWSQEPRWQRSIAYRFLEQPIETCRPTWPSAAAQC